MKKIAMLAAATALTMAGCASAPEVTQEQAHNAIAQANAACAKSAQVNYEWRDACMGEKKKDKKTGEEKHTGFLAKAKDAMAAGDYAKAKKMADKAKKHSDLALEQYEAQKSAGPNF